MKKSKGFTLVELMIVLVVVAILVAIALPSYSAYIDRARRADAKNALLAVQLAQGKWRANNTTYGTLAAIGLATTSPDGYYNIRVAGNTATAFTASAAPTGKQTGDSCGTFILTQAGPDVGTAVKKKCWDK